MNDDQAQFIEAASQLIDQDTPAEQIMLAPLGNHLIGEFNKAVLDRAETERRWLQDLRQYRGKYDPEVESQIPKNKSRAFVRKTRVKVKTLNSRVADLLFPTGKDKNWNIEPTPKPSLSPDQLIEIRELLAKTMAMQAQQAAQAQPAPQAGQPGPQPGQPPAPGAAPTQPQQPIKVTRQMFDQAVQQWAKARCAAMSLTIDDQLGETKYKEICKKAIHSGNLYGTGIVKGPLIEKKIRTRYVNQGGKWVAQSEEYIVPFIDFVPLWRFYPDMSVSERDHCRFIYERHLMSKPEMAALAERKAFNSEKIRAYILANKDGVIQKRGQVDDQLRLIGDRQSGMGDTAGKYEVLERWGYLDGTQLRDAGVNVPDDRLHESFFSNVWMLSNGEVIKAVLQPINGVTWPYHIYYSDKDESSIFGEGIATVMRDDQATINAGTRLLIDNAAITSGAQLEVQTHLLATTQKIDEINPWQVWLRNRESPGVPAIRAIELPSRIAELGNMVGMFENNADETTAVPRYMSGENATAGAAGTSSGLSMLMGNVNIVVKDLISNWDEGVTCSFIKGMYFWNMQFNPDDTIKGDFDISAAGTASLVAKEVRAMALDRFAVATNNPGDAPFIKRDELARQRAEANELTDVVKTKEEIEAEQSSAMAQQMQQMQLEMQQAQLAEAKAKVDKMAAEAEVAKNKVTEMLAKVELIAAQTIQTKVEAAFAALQAGGTATSSPYIAPAGDEILRSAGWKDETPTPSIAQLDSTPVQQTDGTMTKMPKGSTFQQEPRAGDPAPAAPDAAPGAPGAAGSDPANDAPNGDAMHVNEPNSTPADAAAAARPKVATGMVGREHGIETQRIEQPK